MKKKNKSINIEIKKPKADIFFVDPWTVLEPYPEICNFKDKPFDAAKRAFEEYILNGIQWANEGAKEGNSHFRHPSEAICVNNLRLEVKKWREEGYPEVTDTTKELLYHWFYHEREKPLWFSQREAIETLIYLYEVKGIKKITELIDIYSCLDVKGYEAYDHYPRYAFRMATGSGKTIVMALSIVWSFYNYLWEKKGNYTRFFLVIAPNLVVYDRLVRDFENLSIFDEFELIPESWKKDFKMRVVTRDTFSPADRFPPPDEEGVIFVSNIHQIGFKESKEMEEEKDLLSLFGKPSPGKEPYKAKSLRLWEILDNYPGIMILKDEAHHIHREKSSWQNSLWSMDERLKTKYGQGIFAEFDFSATPKDEKGALFPWIIVDFSLREALQTGIVKYPARVVVKDAPEVKRGSGLSAYRPYIKAALQRWREQKSKLKEVGKKAVLFIMGADVEEANEIYKELLKEDDLSESNMILIHSDLEKWEKTQKKLKTKILWKGVERELDKDLARELVKTIDDPENPFEIVVSVMMLNEGWDVRSVTLTLGLRSFVAKREILPEQVIGRGLRKLFPEQGIDLEKWINILEVIGPPRLLKTIQKLEEIEGIKVPENPKKFFVTFSPKENIKEDEDIILPILEGWYYWESIDWTDLSSKTLNRLPAGKFSYNEVEELSYEYPYEVKSIKGLKIAEGKVESKIHDSLVLWINRVAKELEEEIPIPNAFNFLRELIKEYIEKKLFKQEVSIEDEKVEIFLLREGRLNLIVNEIKTVLSEYIKNPLKTTKPVVKEYMRVSESKAFPWTKLFIDSNKSLMARTFYKNGKLQKIPSVPVDNEFEREFVNFLENASDTISFIKNVPFAVGFNILYFDPALSKWRRFYPDFLVKGNDGYYIVETKGREEEGIKYKNEAAKRWCETVNEATDVKWEYIYLTQDIFEKYRISDSIKELVEKV